MKSKTFFPCFFFFISAGIFGCQLSAAQVVIHNQSGVLARFLIQGAETFDLPIANGQTVTVDIDSTVTPYVTIEDLVASAPFVIALSSVPYTSVMTSSGFYAQQYTLLNDGSASRAFVSTQVGGMEDLYIQYFAYGFTVVGLWELTALFLVYLKLLRKPTGENI